MRRSKTAIAPASRDRSLTALWSWDPATWFRDVEQWMDSVSENLGASFPSPVWWSSDQAIRRPLADLRDTGTEFVATAELPGVTKENVEITVTPESLELRAKSGQERIEDSKDYVVRERSYSELVRTVPLPEAVEPEKATAALRDGVLEVRLPKKTPTAETKPHKVPVS